MSAPLGLADLLDAIGNDGNVSICSQSGASPFSSRIVPALEAPGVAMALTGDVWFGVNPIKDALQSGTGRGSVADIDCLVSLYADLDVKDNGLASFAVAHQVVDTLSDLLDSRPVATTLSGHGLQPFWAIEDPPKGVEAQAILRRFGRLVAAVAERYDGKVDSVYDLTRILRVPGTQNHKGEPAIEVLALSDTGRPLTVEEINDALASYGVPLLASDTETIGDVVLPASKWSWANRTCIYVKTMIASWENDEAIGRHPWLLDRTTRLACAHRNGCITKADHEAALTQLFARFRHLLATNKPTRSETPGEIADAIAWGQAKTIAKVDESITEELGNHSHDDALLQLVTPKERPALTVINGGATDGANALDTDPSESTDTLERSEDGHAQQMIAAYGDLIRYCPQRGAWLAWTGNVWAWQPPGGGIIREYAKNTAREFTQSDSAATAHKRRALSASGTGGCLRQAESDPRITVNLPELDNNPWTLNTPAGVIDLRTGELSAPDPKALCTKITTASADFGTTDAAWTQFLDDTFGGDRELRDYVQRLFGLSLIGNVREQIMPFPYGVGANGKSTIVEAIMHAVGIGEGGYSIAAPSEMLMIRKHSEHPAELAQLAGARLVVCSELDDGQKFAEAKIKKLTGRDSINARFLYGQPFTFQPSHSIWLIANHRPQTSSGGDAFWRRIKLIHFAHVVPAARRDPALGDKLAAAAGVVLAWAIRGAIDYLQGGIREPSSVSEATAAYAADQDTIGRFVDELVHLSPGVDAARISVSDLRSAYERWCSESGETPVAAKRLTQELRDRYNITTVKGSKGARFYTGCTLLNSEKDADEDSKSEWFK